MIVWLRVRCNCVSAATLRCQHVAAVKESYLLDDLWSSGMFQVHTNTLKSDNPSVSINTERVTSGRSFNRFQINQFTSRINKFTRRDVKRSSGLSCRCSRRLFGDGKFILHSSEFIQELWNFDVYLIFDDKNQWVKSNMDPDCFVH